MKPFYPYSMEISKLLHLKINFFQNFIPSPFLPFVPSPCPYAHKKELTIARKPQFNKLTILLFPSSIQKQIKTTSICIHFLVERKWVST